MSEQLITSVVTVLTAIIGVAIIATLVSKNANTSQVIQSGGSAFSQALGTALSPVTGGGGFGSFTGGGGSLSLSNL
jgi:PRD1 phage membrane DNA delivery